MTRETEVRQGCRVTFDNDTPDPASGIVNGTPWVYFDGVNAVARVPVCVPATNECIDVAGTNILSVERRDVVEEIRAYTERS